MSQKEKLSVGTGSVLLFHTCVSTTVLFLSHNNTPKRKQVGFAMLDQGSSTPPASNRKHLGISSL